MPHLKVFGTEYGVAADDLAIMGFAGLLYRVAWVAVCASFLVFTFFDIQFCIGSERDWWSYWGYWSLALYFFAGLTLLSLIQVLFFGRMIAVSLRGTILEHESRKSMSTVVAIMAFVEVFQFLCTGLGAWTLAQLVMADSTPDVQEPWMNLETCPVGGGGNGIEVTPSDGKAQEIFVEEFDFHMNRQFIFLVFSLAVSFVHHVGFILIFTLGRVMKDKKSVMHLSPEERSRIRWNRRCRCFCKVARAVSCNLFGGINGDDAEEGFEAVAEIFSKFYATLNLTNSDLIAGLLLLRAEQRAMEEEAVAKNKVRTLTDPGSKPKMKRANTRESHKFQRIGGVDLEAPGAVHVHPKAAFLNVSSTTENDRAGFADAISRVQQYAPFMLGIYGWRIFLYMNRYKPLHGIQRLLLPSGGRTRVEGDNCCHFGAKTLLAHDPGSAEVVFASFANYANQRVPIAVTVNHKSQEVIIVCRGTLSLADAMTDAVIHPTSLEAAGARWGFSGEGHFAHSGFLKVSQKLREELEQVNVLQRLFRRESSAVAGEATAPEPILQVDADDAMPDCRGYALRVVGHSLGAGIATLLSLMLKPAYPSLRCVCYSCPGTVLSLEMAEETKDWIDNVFVGKDFAVMASWRAMKNLRVQVMDVLARCKVNKSTVMRTMFQNIPASELLRPKGDHSDSPTVQRFLEQAEQIKNATDEVLDKVELYPAGKLLHLMKVKTTHKEGWGPSWCRVVERHWVPMWVEDRRLMGEFKISSRMLFDHFPDYIARVIDDVADEYLYYSPSTETLRMKTFVDVNPKFTGDVV